MIQSALCNRAKVDFLQGIHQPGDSYRIALFSAEATLGAETWRYNPAGEVSGPGYQQGGLPLIGFSASLVTGVAVLTFADAAWPVASITARGALIYNATRGDRAICVLDFGDDRTAINGRFTVAFPKPDNESGLIRIS